MKQTGEILLGLMLACLLGAAFALWLASFWMHASSPDDARIHHSPKKDEHRTIDQ